MLNTSMIWLLVGGNLAAGLTSAIRYKTHDGSWWLSSLIAALTGLVPATTIATISALTPVENQSSVVLWSAPLTALLQFFTLSGVWKATDSTFAGAAKVNGFAVVLPTALMMVISAIGLNVEKYNTRQKEIAAETKAEEEKEAAAAKAKKAKGETAKDSKDATAKGEPEEKEPELTAEEKIWGKGGRVNKYRGNMTLVFRTNDYVSETYVAYGVEHPKASQIVGLPKFQSAVLQIGNYGGGKLTDPEPYRQAKSGMFLKGSDRKVAQRILKLEITETKVTVVFRAELPDDDDVIEAQQAISGLLYYMKTRVGGGDKMVVSPIDSKTYTIEAAPLRIVAPKKD